MMALKTLMKSSGVAALAAGLAVLALPAAALADPGENARGGWQGRGSEARSSGEARASGEGRGGNWNEGGRRGGGADRQQPAPQAQSWSGGGRGNGWQDRPAQGGRNAGNWNANGAGNPPVQAWNGQPDARNQQGWQHRNPGYADAERNRRYRAESDDRRPQQGWNGQRWNGQNWDRNGDNRGNWQRDRDWRRDNNWQRDRDWQRDRNRGWGADRHAAWNRDWRRDNRYNWSGWRSHHRDVFRMGRYQPPYRSWSYRRLSIGFFLGSGFYASSYWLDDPYAYRLPPPYGPYRWVRYYDDALLVNIYNGEVVDVIYDLFW